jgi:hypothetical protein
MKNKSQHLRICGLSLFLLLASSGCGLLFGNVKPVDEKSDDYGVLDLSKNSSEWAKLDPKTSNPEAKDADSRSTEVSDVAFQSKKTASIISLNSSCNPEVQNPDKDLRSFTNLLFLGITDITLRDERTMNFQNSPALQTTLRGKLNGEEMMLRTVVLRKRNCLYDLMYVARPAHFLENEPDFSRFASSLKLK